MNILNITSSDKVGETFNNFAMSGYFNEINIHHKFLVSSNQSSQSNVLTLYSNLATTVNLKLGSSLNYYSGYQNRLNFWSKRRIDKSIPRDMDLLHFHLIENGWFNIPKAFQLMSEHPSIWTFHDLWPLTGHCIQPMSCSKWLQNCHPCPDLGRPFSVKIDVASKQQSFKLNELEKSRVQIHVSTNWAQKQIGAISKNLQNRTRVIPFGITIPPVMATRDQIRQKFGLNKNDIVIVVRGTSGNYKTIQSLKNVLKHNSETSKNLVLIDIDSQNAFESVELKMLINLEWQNRSTVMDLIRSSNAVIIPSSAETFGVLVAEAQLCGVPVLVQKNTSCEEVAGNHETSFSFSGASMDSEVIQFIKLLLDRDKTVSQIAENGRQWAIEKYNPELYVMRMSNFYKDVIEQYNY